MSTKLISPRRWLLIVYLLGVLSGCSDNQTAESLVAPDPRLQQQSQTTPEVTPSPVASGVVLPETFPQIIPVYPQSELLSVSDGLTEKQGTALWQSTDPINLIESYYQKQLSAKNWQIEENFSSEAENNSLTAYQDNLELKISLKANGTNTDIAINYQETQPPQAESSPTPTETETPTPVSFSDSDKIPTQFRSYVEDLAALGVLNVKTDSQFAPNEVITRREYARWLVAAYNKIYALEPSKQLRLASEEATPVFQDISNQDPDFPIIQGLAGAGVIPSSLSGENSALQFRPDAPVTRETLLEWKVPLDLGKALPSAGLDTIKETWGFQDASQISPEAWRSLYADFQNGDQANIRRVFGYTTLFQPKKTVTRAEVAASLWYFGFQGEGISAQEALKFDLR